MLEKVFKDYIDYINNETFTAQEVAMIAIRQLFTGIQQGKGEYQGQIRLRKKLVDCTMEGMIYEVSNRGHKVTLISRTYDAVVKTSDQECILYKSSLYFSNW
jgi:hypothetical protein